MSSKKYVTHFRGDMLDLHTPTNKMKIKDEPETPIEEDFGEHNRLDNSFENDCSANGSMRRSMSMGDIAALREEVMDYQNASNYHRHRPNGLEDSKAKFVSMAEAVYHYHRDTPTRYHSSRPQIFRPNGFVERKGLTMPQSPMLRCKARSRPLHVLSQEEKEKLELEEIRKHKIKAQPIPKSVIEGSRNLPDVPRRPRTVPEPFNLTEVPKKVVEVPDPLQVKFKARPVPKDILEKPFIPMKHMVYTHPVSPKFHSKKPMCENKKKLDNNGTCTVEKAVRVGPVRPEPFSFEKRDEELKKRKEEKIRHQIEEERKQASLFKAQPLPGAVKRQFNRIEKNIHSHEVKSHTSSSSDKENTTKFEARPPTVLYKEPFKPLLQQMAVKPPVPFHLCTEKRASEREQFEKQLREKEEEQERLKYLREKEEQEMQERARAELRAKLIHHPKPVPTFTPFIPEKSDVIVTVPETPTFVRRYKKQ